MRFPAITLTVILTAAVILAILKETPQAKEEMQDSKPSTFAGKAPARRIEAPPVSFPELVRDADRIFQGSVTSIVDVKTDGLKDGIALKGALVEEVSFTVQKAYKGVREKQLTIRQAKSLGVFHPKTGRLLVYLSPNSRIGLTQPVGVYSGYFTIHPDRKRKGKFVASNLLDNEGLWGESKNLLGSYKGAMEALDKKLLMLKLSVEDRKSLLQAAVRPESPGPLPLELLEAATEVLVGSEKKGKD
jgi:hypothetical protein